MNTKLKLGDIVIITKDAYGLERAFPDSIGVNDICVISDVWNGLFFIKTYKYGRFIEDDLGYYEYKKVDKKLYELLGKLGAWGEIKKGKGNTGDITILTGTAVKT